MASHVTKHNWPAELEATLKAVLDTAASYPSGSAEAETLVREATQLRVLREMVRDRVSENREPVTSYLIAVSAREGISFPDDIIRRAGALHDIYRRWRRELAWEGWQRLEQGLQR